MFIDSSRLEELADGLKPGKLTILAARPAIGKTALTMDFIRYFASKGKKVRMFSLEMSEKMVRGLLKAGEPDYETESVLFENVIVDDTAGITADEICSRCCKEKTERGLDLVVIEYMQLISTERRGAEAYGEILKKLKSLAEELECSVFAESQLPRSVDAREDHRPMISDLFNEEAVRQYADNVLFLYREACYTKEYGKPGETELIIAKGL